MPDLVLAKPMLLTLNNGERVFFSVGLHRDVSREVLDHPYTQHFIAKDGKLPEMQPSAPLSHEERVAMKAELDAAAVRVKVAEAERDAHRDDLDKAKARIVELEADLDKATKPAVTGSVTAKPK